MSPCPVVIDTNIFVAAGFNPRSKSRKILDAIRDDQIQMVWNNATRQEIEHILQQIPPLHEYIVSGLFRPENQVTSLTHPESFTEIPDPDDRKFAALAFAARAILVSNDRHLLRFRDQLDFKILAPGDYWKQVQSELKC